MTAGAPPRAPAVPDEHEWIVRLEIAYGHWGVEFRDAHGKHSVAVAAGLGAVDHPATGKERGVDAQANDGKEAGSQLLSHLPLFGRNQRHVRVAEWATDLGRRGVRRHLIEIAVVGPLSLGWLTFATQRRDEAGDPAGPQRVARGRPVQILNR